MDATELANQIANVWLDLPKGPNLNLEQYAVERNKNNRLNSAYKFLSIIEEAIRYTARGIDTMEIKNRPYLEKTKVY